MEDNRKIVGYVRTLKDDENSSEIQRELIMSYCKRHGMICSSVFTDIAGHYCRKEDYERAVTIGLSVSRWRTVFVQWENMLQEIMAGAIKCVLVDTALRLYNGDEQREIFYRICQNHKVQIIEVGWDAPIEDAIIVYHRSLEPDKRTYSVLQDVDNLYSYSRLFKDSREIRLLLDTKNVRSNYKKIRELKDCMVICKRFDLLNRKILSVVHLAQNNEIVSMEEGKLAVTPLFDIPARVQRVVVYDKMRSNYEIATKDIRIEKFALFSERMQWNIVGTYADTMQSRTTERERMINDLEQYDAVLMDSLAKLDEKAGIAFKMISKIGKPIYTLQEGEVELWKKK